MFLQTQPAVALNDHRNGHQSSRVRKALEVWTCAEGTGLALRTSNFLSLKRRGRLEVEHSCLSKRLLASLDLRSERIDMLGSAVGCRADGVRRLARRPPLRVRAASPPVVDHCRRAKQSRSFNRVYENAPRSRAARPRKRVDTR